MHRLIIATTLSCGLLLAGCAADEPTFGERLQTQGAGLAQIGENWSEGAEKVERGEELLEKGRDQVKDGRRNIARGEDLIEEGRALMSRAEKNYDTRTSSALQQ